MGHWPQFVIKIPDISQGSVATRLGHGGVFSVFDTNLVVMVNSFENWSTFDSVYRQQHSGTLLTHGDQ